MFDFRYHAVSLVAVLVALVVGLLLGVAIGDAGLVSSAEKQVRDSLRGDVRAAQRDAQKARNDLVAEQRYSEAAYPLLVAGRLDGAKIGVVFFGNASEEVLDETRAALEDSGGKITGILAVRRPPDREAIAAAAEGTRYVLLADDPALLREFGERIGVQLVQGGRLIQRESDAVFSTRSGALGPFDGVVFVRNEPKLKGDDLEESGALEAGIVAGVVDNPVTSVGAQLSGTKPSQIQWYREHQLSSVDNLDTMAGHAALVFTLAGSPGSFGTGALAQSLLPGPESLSLTGG